MILALLLLVAANGCEDRGGDLAAAQCWSAEGNVADGELNGVWQRIVKKARASDEGVRSVSAKAAGQRDG